MDVTALRRRIEILNEKLRPIADRPIAFGPDLRRRLAALPNPLDEAGVRDEAQSALLAAVELYARVSPEERQEIRELFRNNRAFAWAATLPFPPDNAARFRQHLIRFSILDGFPDVRDAILWLRDLRRSTFYDEVCDEIAEQSSEATRKLLIGR